MPFVSLDSARVWDFVGALKSQSTNPIVGQVLISSVAEVAGKAWRPEYGRAWAAAFDVVAGAMLVSASASSASALAA